MELGAKVGTSREREVVGWVSPQLWQRRIWVTVWRIEWLLLFWQCMLGAPRRQTNINTVQPLTIPTLVKLFYYYFNWQNIVMIKSIGNSGNMRMTSHVLSLVLVFFPGMFLLGGSSIISFFLSQAYWSPNPKLFAKVAHWPVCHRGSSGWGYWWRYLGWWTCRQTAGCFSQG